MQMKAFNAARRQSDDEDAVNKKKRDISLSQRRDGEYSAQKRADRQADRQTYKQTDRETLYIHGNIKW